MYCYSLNVRLKANFLLPFYLTFDDDVVESWYENKALFDKYNVKVTFFVTRPHKLSETQVNMLRQLQAEGHEIACHTLNHIDALAFINKYGIEKYLYQEVDSCKAILLSQGFDIQSFAYPFGSSNETLIDSLKTRFTFQRGAIYNQTDFFHRQKRSLNKWDNIFISAKNTAYSDGMGIDKNYENTFKRIQPGIDRCKKNAEVLVLYSHTIVKHSENDCEIEVTSLDSILNYATKQGVKFLRCKDIYSK